jgi:hypothetical protein
MEGKAIATEARTAELEKQIKPMNLPSHFNRLLPTFMMSAIATLVLIYSAVFNVRK